MSLLLHIAQQHLVHVCWLVYTCAWKYQPTVLCYVCMCACVCACAAMLKLGYDTSLWPPMAHQEEQRLVYAIDYLQHSDKKSAAKVSGLNSPNAHKRVLDHLKQYGRFGEATHVRERSKFTNAVMQAAVDILTETSSGYMNTHELLCELDAQGILSKDSDHAHFRAALRDYLQTLGLWLSVGHQTIFRITDTTAEERLAFVKEYRPKVEGWKLENVVIVDETTIEESPHPKGTHAQQQ
jgi:hypothetical protein